MDQYSKEFSYMVIVTPHEFLSDSITYCNATRRHKYLKRGYQEIEIRKEHTNFINDLKPYQENHEKLKLVNRIIVKTSTDNGTCYGVKQCRKVVLEKAK